MHGTIRVVSLMVLLSVTRAAVGQPPGGEATSARQRNERLAERTKPAERIGRLHQVLYGRDADADETALGLRFVEEASKEPVKPAILGFRPP